MSNVKINDAVSYFTHDTSTSCNMEYVQAGHSLTHYDKTKPLVANVTAVNGDGTVDLIVTDELNFQQVRNGVTLLPVGQKKDGGGYAVLGQ